MLIATLLQASVCHDCRQSEPSPLQSPTASLTLPDVIHEVPTLPELLTMDDQKALSAASRNFCLSFFAHIQVVTVTCVKDFALVTQCR